MQISRFDPATDAGPLRICHQLIAVSQRVDDPDGPAETYDAFARRWTNGSGAAEQTWLGTADSGAPVGCYRLKLPADDAAAAICYLVVTPASRRAGIGTTLLDHCAAQARLTGRSRVAGNVRDGSPGAAFAAAKGAIGGAQLVTRTLQVDAHLAARLAATRVRASQLAAGYELLSWLGQAPREYLDQLALVRNAMADAPSDGGHEHRDWDADRIARTEHVQVARGLRMYAVAARHLVTRELAGFTQVFTDPGKQGWAIQQLTAVLPGHRGHRLGLLIKIEMIELLIRHEPGPVRIETWNAGANEHMVAINDELGFRISATHRYWALGI